MKAALSRNATGRASAALAGVAALALLFAAACASSGSPKAKDSNKGFKTLEATVVERQHDMPGSGGASYAGSGNYYLSFEARDGEATAHYRFQVTKGQYDRYVEGSHVRLVIADNELRDIRPMQ